MPGPDSTCSSMICVLKRIVARSFFAHFPGQKTDVDGLMIAEPGSDTGTLVGRILRA